jgi:hypothetical protein
MKKTFWRGLGGGVLLALLLAACSKENNVPPEPAPVVYAGEILYSFAPEAPATDAYAVTLNGQPCYVYPSQTADIVTFGIDANGPILVTITPKEPVTTVKIRPESAGITPTLEGNVITFTLSQPQYISVETDCNTSRPLLLFADAPETGAPDPSDPSVRYFEAGKIHEPGRIDVTAQQKTVYIAPGAIVYGSLRADANNNLRIAGRGILSGERFAKQTSRMVELNRLQNARVKGITIVDAHHWTVAMLVCDGVYIEDVKIVNDAPTDDGIDITGSKNVHVNHCFIRTADDCVAIKAGINNYYFTIDSGKDVTDVSVKNSIFWNVNPGSNVFEIGYELNTDTVKNILYQNNDIIHLPGNLYSEKGAFAIHNSGRAVVDNITYKDIRIEDATVYLMDFQVLYSYDYTPKETPHGYIGTVNLENISVSATGALRSVMRSYSETANVRQVRIKNLTVNGRKITRLEELYLMNSTPYTEVIFEQ